MASQQLAEAEIDQWLAVDEKTRGFIDPQRRQVGNILVDMTDRLLALHVLLGTGEIQPDITQLHPQLLRLRIGMRGPDFLRRKSRFQGRPELVLEPGRLE